MNGGAGDARSAALANSTREAGTCRPGVPEVCPRLLSLEQAAEYLSISYWTVRDLVAAGSIPRVRLSVGSRRDLRRVLVDRRDLDALIEANKERG